MFGGDPSLYSKVGSEFGAHTLKNGGPKTSKVGPNFGQLHNVIANIFGEKQYVIEGKTALQTAILPAYKYLISLTLVYKRRK